MIISSLIGIVLVAAELTFLIHLKGKHEALVSPGQISAMASFENPKEELPVLLSGLQRLARYEAGLAAQIMFFTAIFGVFIGLLIISCVDLTHRRLLVSMWDRIQELERRANCQERGQQEDGQVSSEAAASDEPSS